MGYNTMSHVGLEADYGVTKEQLTHMSKNWHYGWRWTGPEVCNTCVIAPCGLVVVPQNDCEVHRHKKMASAKQLHHEKDCAGAR